MKNQKKKALEDVGYEPKVKEIIEKEDFDCKPKVRMLR